MLELKMRNYEKTEEEIPIEFWDNYNFKGFKIGDELLQNINIPSVKSEYGRIYYLNKNNADYITILQNDVAKNFFIKFGMNKQEIEIQDISLSIRFADKFKNYIVPSSELFASALKEELLEILKYLPFTEKEKEWYKNKIQQYIDEHTGTRMVSLSGGFKINEDEMPVTETFAPQEQNLTLNTNKLKFPLEFRGKIYENLKEICKDYNIKYSTVWGRINERELSLEEAIFSKVAPRNKKRIAKNKGKSTYNSIGITYKGKYYPSISQLAEEYGIARATLASRIKNGWDIDKAVNEPPQPVGRNLYR